MLLPSTGRAAAPTTPHCKGRVKTVTGMLAAPGERSLVITAVTGTEVRAELPVRRHTYRGTGKTLALFRCTQVVLYPK